MRNVEMQETAAVLLRLLGEGGGAAAAFGNAQQVEEAAAETVSFAPGESERETLRTLQDALEAQSAARQRELAEADAAQKVRAAAAEAEEEAVFAAQTVGLRETAGVQSAPDMNAISEFFRRDSRRYDNGF